MKYKLLILVCFFVMVSCVDTHKDIFVSGVNIEDLSKILTKQKCHNKAIFIFDPGCPTCIFYLQNEFPVMQKQFLDSVDYVFIAMDTIPFEKYKEFFHSIGIKTGHLLSLRKDNQNDSQTKEKILSEAMQYLFSNKEDIHIKGFPISAIANKENRLKLEYFRLNDSTLIIQPQPWHRLDSLSLEEIDFNTIDSVKYSSAGTTLY